MDKKIKIAVCFSGQMRCHWKLTDIWVKNFFDVFNTETFDLHIFMYSNKDYENTLNDIVKAYSNYKLTIKTEDDPNFNKILGLDSPVYRLRTISLNRGNHNQLLNEFHSMDKVVEMKSQYEVSHNIKFDYIFRTRYDLIPLTPFDTSILKKDDVLYISNHDNHCDLNARFTMCGSETSNEVYKIIKNVNNFSNNIDFFSGEHYWYHHIKSLGIKIGYIEQYFGLVRDYDDKLPKNEQGCISINGDCVYWFKNDSNRLNLSELKMADNYHKIVVRGRNL